MLTEHRLATSTSEQNSCGYSLWACTRVFGSSVSLLCHAQSVTHRSTGQVKHSLLSSQHHRRTCWIWTSVWCLLVNASRRVSRAGGLGGWSELHSVACFFQIGCSKAGNALSAVEGPYHSGVVCVTVTPNMQLLVNTEIQRSACFLVPVYRLCVRCVHSRTQAGLSEDLPSDGCNNHSDLLGKSDGLKGDWL